MCVHVLLHVMRNVFDVFSYWRFLHSYLEPRKAQVVVEGINSDEFEITNTVFQGTVLGPPLWNSFFSDVTGPAEETGGAANLFADDLSVFQEFEGMNQLKL